MIDKAKIICLLRAKPFLKESEIYAHYEHFGYKYPFIELERSGEVESVRLSDGIKSLKYYFLPESRPKLEEFCTLRRLKEEKQALRKPVLHDEEKNSKMLEVIEFAKQEMAKRRRRRMCINPDGLTYYQRYKEEILEKKKVYYKENRERVLAKYHYYQTFTPEELIRMVSEKGQ